MPDFTSTLCLVLCLIIREVFSYSTGAPTRACGDITPQHGFSITTSPAPYLVEVSKTQYAPNERIYVRIRACGNKKFKGFMIQPRSAMFPNRPAFLGAFLRVRGTRYECVRTGGVLTHSSPVEKQSLTLTWIAPPGAAGHVVFRVTFVESFTSYWVGINSPVVYDGVSPDLTLMQAFSLQSPAHQSCLPASQNTTTTTARALPTVTTQTTTTTTTRRPTEAFTFPVRQTTTEAYYTDPPTTTTPTTTTTTTTMRPTTTRATTTRKPTTTTTTQPTTTTPTTTTTTTLRPTTTRVAQTTTEDYYYFYWDTTTLAAIPTAPPTTTKNVPPTTTTSTTTTTTTVPPPTTQPTTTTTTQSPPTTTTTTNAPTTTTAYIEPTTTTAYPTTTTTARQPTTTMRKYTTEQRTTIIPDPPTTIVYFNPTTVREPFTTTTAATPTMLPVQPTTRNMPKVPETTNTRFITDTGFRVVTDKPFVVPTTAFNVGTSTSKAAEPTTNYVYRPTTQTSVYFESAGTTYYPDFFGERSTHTNRIYPTTGGQQFRDATTRDPYRQHTVAPFYPTTLYPFYPTTRKTFYPPTSRTESGRNGINFPPELYPMYPWYTTTTAAPASVTTTTVSNNAKIDTTQKINGTKSFVDISIPSTLDPFMFEPFPTTRKNYIETSTRTIDIPTTRNIDILTTRKIETHTTRAIDIATTRRMYIPTTRKMEIPATRQMVPAVTTTTETYRNHIIVEHTVPTQEYRLSPDYACGSTQGCFDDCKNGVCNFIISWKADKDVTHFEIRTKPRVSGPYWAAVGFSDDKMMGLDSVTECITDGLSVELFQSYNLDYYRNMRLLTPKLGLLNTGGSLDNGIFRCSFTRQNYVTGEKDVFDLSKDWHMMYAEGSAVNGIKIPHRYDVVPPVSRDRMDLQRYPPMHETYDYNSARTENIKVINVTDPPIPTLKHRRIAMDNDCGSKKSCFQDCSGSGCNFIVSWVPSIDHVAFNIRTVLNETRNQWVAIAFSDDKLMGNDSVVQCVSDEDDRIHVLHSYNNGHNNIIVKDAMSGLHNTSASFVDGVFECNFVRDRRVEGDQQIFDLNRPWSIHFAHGRSKKGIMLPHTLDEKPHVSDDLVDFSKTSLTLLSANDFFIKIHASLMIFAWILCASIASVIGRYFQPYYWGEKMLGSKTWIKVHWLFVLLTCATVIAGFAVIFVGVDGISELYQHPEMGFNGTHPIMGLVVTLLALLNPLLLCLRPSEDSQSRAFFNCLYWLVEIGAHVLAVVTIYAGFGLAHHLVPSFFTFLLIGFTVYQILTLLFMEALKSFDAKKTIEKKKLYLYEMQIRPWNQRKNTNNSLAAYIDLNHTSKGLKQMVLAAHLILLSALTTVMVLLIVIR